MPSTPPPTHDTARSPWAAFRHRHLYDYPGPALAAWLAITGCGAAACGWALFGVASSPGMRVPELLAALAMVALASSFALKLPRSAYTLSVADVFIFSTLAALGPTAAVLASGIEGAIGTWRTSRRLSSRLSSPAAAMAAMAVCGLAFEALAGALITAGWAADLAAMVALATVALIPYALTTMPLMTMMALKRGEPLRPGEWFADSAWMAAVFLAAALLAGLVYLNAQRYGTAVLGVLAASVLALVWLLRLSFRRQEEAHTKQQSLVDQAQRDAELSQRRFTAAFTHAAIGMAVVQPEGSIVQVNDALCELLGRNAEELVGKPFCSLLHEGDAALFRRRADAVLADAKADYSIEVRAVPASGEELWVALHCSQFADPGGSGRALIYQLHDITSRHLAESRLHHIAYHDGLTDLANRSCFHERLEVAVEASRLDAGRRFAVLFLDLDRFKMVNDSLGHQAGNELLREVAQRLRACVRPGDLVARLGGDEFAILFEQLHDAETGMRLAQRVLEMLMRPLMLQGTEVVPGASVGITFSDLGYRTVHEILRDADLAMYEAKAGGRGRVAIFDSSMHDKVAERLALEADLRHAIGEGQLGVHFQPIFELDPYRLVGFEALARWTHPQRGPISPAVFIGLAEDSGHIDALTDWVIEHSLAQLATWRGERGERDDGAALTLNINVSSRDLARPALADHVRRVLATHGLPPSALTLEITETSLMERLDMALQTMDTLGRDGVRFSIDDFGTGYSSLAYLGSLPIDSLKIDRSFVIGLADKPQNVEIVRTIVELGRTLNRRVVAEGIETAEQLATLRRLGVPLGQGYLLSRPLRADQVGDLLAVTMEI